MRARPWTIGLLLGAALLCNAAAEQWTVQTVALRDYRDAQARVSSLRSLGFDAYSEFVMEDAHQFIRIRVGCFASREAAASMAETLAPAITREAVAVPLTPGAKVRGCVSYDVGFLTPQRWEILIHEPARVVFAVSVAGREAWVTFDGRGWQVDQAAVAPPASAGVDARPADFVQLYPLGRAVVAHRLNGLAFCGGRLLWQAPGVAVVEQAGAVVACRVSRTPQGG